ncbi:SGNH/GDSL hydrolase family protein [Streptomyces sp. PvR018]|uniref:SGNH/GDSL hydrolase family protein n=1 Tax=Streptomyces sp. PvR018 TaxID=3156442 RepID=UPI0033909FFC
MAAESVPQLQWPAALSSRYVWETIASPSDVTNGCVYANGTFSNLKTFDDSGQVVRELTPSQTVDGIENCIISPTTDKNGDLYGVPYGRNASGNWVNNPNLLAYDGNTLKWKYPTQCNMQPTIGADGNIYTLSSTNGSRLIGLTPEVESGTNQPKKVLDIAHATPSCDGQLHALKSGLAVLKGMRVTFYSYNGKSFGGPGNNVYIDHPEQISADGRVFYPVMSGSGSSATVQVVAYNGFRKETAWTAQASTFGQGGVQYHSSNATPDGGVVVVVKRPKVVGGIPTSEKVWAVIKLNAFGVKMWEKDLLNTYANNPNNSFGSPRVVVDTTGKTLLVRGGSVQTNDPYNGSVPAILIGVLDGNGDVAYSEIMRGNLDKTTGAVNGYTVQGQGNNGPTTGPDTLYLLAACEEGCQNYLETRLYAIEVPGLGLDYPRGAVLAQTQRPAASYIALGDSFSSGEGVEPFEDETELPGVNTCHRSEDAYARLISGTGGVPSLGSDGFRACSGAVTDNITDAPQWNEGIQLDWWPDATTELVTMTIGGNDIGFGDYAEACVYLNTSCAINSAAYNTALGKINNELPAKLEATYKRILKYAPNADIYVVGYPQVVAAKVETDPLVQDCIYLADGGTRWSEAQAVRDITTKLNAKILQKVDDVRALDVDNQRLHFVDVNGATSPFKTHEICGSSGTSWFQNLNEAQTNKAYVFHPNAAGHANGYAPLVAAEINAG